jgi:protein-disulfide isomerase
MSRLSQVIFIILTCHLRRPEVVRLPKLMLFFFACFGCPMCAHLALKIKKSTNKFKGKVGYFYKFFPVRSHKHGVPAAMAGLAAARQGKFWQIYYMLYANRIHLEDSDLEKYAAKIRLDMTKFKADIKNKSLMKQIKKDKLPGMRLGVDSYSSWKCCSKIFWKCGFRYI